VVSGGAEVMVTRHRDVFEGQRLKVLGRSRRRGRVELLVVLPDGSKRVIPAAWTDESAGRGGAAATLASPGDLLALCALVSARDDPPEGELRTVADAARQLGLAGQQPTPRLGTPTQSVVPDVVARADGRDSAQTHNHDAEHGNRNKASRGPTVRRPSLQGGTRQRPQRSTGMRRQGLGL